MRTERRRARLPVSWVLGVALLAGGSAGAQPDGRPLLSSPLGTAPVPAKPGKDEPMLPGSIDKPGLPVGSGPGYHDPRSPFKPLQDREGVVSWSLLASVTLKQVKNRILPVFPDPVKALHNKTVKVQGFMMPLDPGERQKHFLLSAVPTTCSFCVPAGPEGLVQVRSSTPVRYTIEPLVIEGRLEVLEDDPFGVYYRIVDGKPSK